MVNKYYTMTLYFGKDLECACGSWCQKGHGLWVWGRWKPGCGIRGHVTSGAGDETQPWQWTEGAARGRGVVWVCILCIPAWLWSVGMVFSIPPHVSPGWNPAGPNRNLPLVILFPGISVCNKRFANHHYVRTDSESDSEMENEWLVTTYF